MIDRALTFFQDRLNTYIKIKTGGQKEDVVHFPEIQPPRDLSLPSNTVSIMLIGLEEERTFRSGANQSQRLGNGVTIDGISRLCLNLHVMFISNFTDYVESLRILSLILKFFRSYRTFDRSNSPALSPEIEKLTTELINLSFMEQGELWRSLEMPSSPSVLYKVRMLIFEDMEMESLETAGDLGAVQAVTEQL